MTFLYEKAVLRHKNPNTTARYLHSLGIENARAGLEKIGGGDVVNLKAQKNQKVQVNQIMK